MDLEVENFQRREARRASLNVFPARAGSKHWAVFVIAAALIALSFFARHVAGYIFTQGAYNPFVYNPAVVRHGLPPAQYSFRPDDASWDETRAYGRWTQEIRRGELVGATPGTYAPFFSPEISDHGIWIRDRIGPLLLAGISFLCGGVPTAFAWADLLFPFLTALAVFWLAWTIRPSIPFALSSGVLICIFDWADLRRFVESGATAGNLYSNLGRTPYPQLSLALFVGFLVLLIRTLKEPDIGNVLFLAGALTVNFYTYFYSWFYACCWISIALVQVIFASRKGNPAGPKEQFPKLRALLFATSIALAFSLPVYQTALYGSQAALDSFFRLNGELTHRPNLEYAMLFGVAAIVILRMRPWEGRDFAVCFIFASILVLNQQVITGKSLQPGHWTAYFIQPLIWLVLLDFSWQVIEGFPVRFGIVAAWALLALGVAFNATKLVVSARSAVEYNRVNREFTELVDRLNLPEYRGCAYLTNDPYLTELLPGYTIAKPLEPWYMDPISNDYIALFRQAIAREFPWSSSSGYTSVHSVMPPLYLRPEKVMVVLNRNRRFAGTPPEGLQTVFRNNDFDLLVPHSCSGS